MILQMESISHVLIIQPPLVQLNAPYPSGAYLSSFFRSQGANAKWYDFSSALFRAIFCKEGLEKLFSLSEKNALSLADKAEKNGDKATSENLRRYVSESGAWCDWIDEIVAILTSGNGEGTAVSGREICHRLVFSPHAPRAFRMQRYLDSLEKEPTTDDARSLASLALADLADYIAIAFDKDFSLVRYAESLAINETHFSQIEKAVDSPILSNFYSPILENLRIPEIEGTKTLVCVSVPFPGTFSASLFTGRFLKQKYREKVFVVIGGGFVNTELRGASEENLSRYIDAISFDRGYGSYYALDKSGLLKNEAPSSIKPLYKMRLFLRDAGKVRVIDCIDEDKEAQDFEQEMTQRIVPDYSDIDFSLYPRLTDDTNAMHRLWSDGAWMRAYLAHGCYWHQCAFCDVTLDYVCAYRMTNVKNLYDGLFSQSEKNGVYGIHFVDEACPPVALAEFAKENAKHSKRFLSWGNVRFEKTYTRDIADFLSAGGVAGVSGGIEIATGDGLSDIHKGTDLDSIAGACAAFKEAGILVHAYMIFGYWQETPQTLIDSMETLRQFFALGLIDSAFWHKFVLTRHSRVFKEWKDGKYSELKPIFPADSDIFAKNGLHFKGEEKSERYERGLNLALDAWMHGEGLDADVRRWFDFKMPSPSVSKTLVEDAVNRYEEREAQNKRAHLSEESLMFWLGGKPYSCNGGRELGWIFMQEEYRISLRENQDAKKMCESLLALSVDSADTEARKKALAVFGEKTLKHLRGKGLCVLPDWKRLKD